MSKAHTNLWFDRFSRPGPDARLRKRAHRLKVAAIPGLLAGDVRPRTALLRLVPCKTHSTYTASPAPVLNARPILSGPSRKSPQNAH